MRLGKSGPYHHHPSKNARLRIQLGAVSLTPSILRYGAELPPERRNAHAAGPLPAPQVPAGRHPGGVWLYFRFTLSFREVEEMLAQRGIEASYEPSAAGP